MSWSLVSSSILLRLCCLMLSPAERNPTTTPPTTNDNNTSPTTTNAHNNNNNSKSGDRRRVSLPRYRRRRVKSSPRSVRARALQRPPGPVHTIFDGSNGGYGSFKCCHGKWRGGGGRTDGQLGAAGGGACSAPAPIRGETGREMDR